MLWALFMAGCLGKVTPQEAGEQGLAAPAAAAVEDAEGSLEVPNAWVHTALGDAEQPPCRSAGVLQPDPPGYHMQSKYRDGAVGNQQIHTTVCQYTVT